MSTDNDATGYNTFERSTPSLGLDNNTTYQAQQLSRAESANLYYPVGDAFGAGT